MDGRSASTGRLKKESIYVLESAEMCASRGERQLRMVAALSEPVRRALYEFVAARAPDDVSRDDAAREVGVRRALAAFHLDKLVRSGLLVPVYRRLSERSGPGAGRPAKLYRLAPEEVQVSLPARRYDLIGQFLAGAVADVPGSTAPQRARERARQFGRASGREARQQQGAAGRSHASAARARGQTAACNSLREHGFAPVRQRNGDLILRNCPFGKLASEQRDLVCSINLALQEGFAEGLGDDRLQTEFAPAPGRCCVIFRWR